MTLFTERMNVIVHGSDSKDVGALARASKLSRVKEDPLLKSEIIKIILEIKGSERYESVMSSIYITSSIYQTFPGQRHHEKLL